MRNSGEPEWGGRGSAHQPNLIHKSGMTDAEFS
jgi:hypothetical protein